MVLEPENFELGMPKGSKVVCLSGAYNQNLLSLQAHYEWIIQSSKTSSNYTIKTL
jgi:hypothetical protein